jgi:type I restriction enzyme, S subunit
MSGLPRGWAEASLDECTLLNPKLGHPIPHDALVSFVPMPAVNDASGEIESPQDRSFGEVSKGYTRFQTGDVIFAKITPCMENGKIAVARELTNNLGCGSTEFHVLRPLPGISADYIWRFLGQKSFRADAERAMTGAVGQRRVPLEYLRTRTIPLAPTPEQRRIVARIDSLFAKSRRARAHLDHIPRLVEKYKQAILAAAFRGELTREWRCQQRNREDARSLLSDVRKAHRAKWEERSRAPFVPYSPVATSGQIFPLPPTWVWSAAEEVVEPGCEIVYGIVQPGPKLSAGVPYVRGTDIEDGRIKIDQLLFTSDQIAGKYSRASLQGGDVLLGIIRATKVAVVPDVLTGANITQGTARFRPSKVIRTIFLARWLESSHAQAWLHSKYRGIDMPGLNLRDVRRLPVPLAPTQEQGEIVRRIETAFTWIDRFAAKATSARKLIAHLDQAILAKAFRGELVAQSPTDEPASALLERIGARGQSAVARFRRAGRRSQLQLGL